MTSCQNNDHIRAAHMSGYPPLGQVEANGFYPQKDGGPPSAGCGGGADRPPQPGRDGSASTSHSRKKLKINSKKIFSPTHWREPTDVTDEPVEFEK